MNLKLPDFSTVIIINKSHGQAKSLKIKTKHLNRLGHYAAAIGVVILILVGTVFYLSNKYAKQQQETEKLAQQVEDLKGKLPIIADDKAKTNEAQSYIQQIQGKLTKINQYLSKRGLKGFSNYAVGGNGDASAKLTDVEQYSMYNDYITKVLTSVAFTPMGYPRISSITSIFGFRADPFDNKHAEFHPGIDFQGQTGDAVRCTANGHIVFAGWAGGYGNCIRIAHTNNFETLYGHLSKIEVKVGQTVKVGDVIGKVGSTGRTTAPHLHYEVRKDGKPINPVKFLTLNN